jgi:hypothetical protein
MRPHFSPRTTHPLKITASEAFFSSTSTNKDGVCTGLCHARQFTGMIACQDIRLKVLLFWCVLGVGGGGGSSPQLALASCGNRANCRPYSLILPVRHAKGLWAVQGPCRGPHPHPLQWCMLLHWSLYGSKAGCPCVGCMDQCACNDFLHPIATVPPLFDLPQSATSVASKSEITLRGSVKIVTEFFAFAINR